MKVDMEHRLASIAVLRRLVKDFSMDADRFDTLTRSLTTAGSRRGALAAVLSGAVSLLSWQGIETVDAHNPKAACKKKSGDAKKKCLKKAKQQVFGADVVVVQAAGFFLGGLDRPPGPIRETSRVRRLSASSKALEPPCSEALLSGLLGHPQHFADFRP